MSNIDAAVMAMAGASAIGFLIADGEAKRIKWVIAMRRCLLRLSGVIRYERKGICALLRAVDLQGTPQEKALTRLLHASATSAEAADRPDMALIFAEESVRLREYGVLSTEDREPFEHVVSELGRNGMQEQLRLIEEADERLRQREEILRRDGGRRVRLIRTLGVCCGAGFFLILI